GDTHHERPGREPFIDVSSLHCAHSSNARFPVSRIVLIACGNALVRFQHSPLRLFALPELEREFVVKDTLQLMALQWSMNRFAADLLPPASRLFIAHDEVLVVDAC